METKIEKMVNLFDDYCTSYQDCCDVSFDISHISDGEVCLPIGFVSSFLFEVICKYALENEIMFWPSEKCIYFLDCNTYETNI